MARPRTIDRERILAAAMTVADEQGTQALTLAAVAARLGVTSMALYRHVHSKTALLDGLVEQLLIEISRTAATDRTGAEGFEALAALAHAARRVAALHPGAFPLVLVRPAATPAALEIRADVHALLRDLGVRAEHVGQLERIVTTTVLGLAAGQASDRFARHPPDVHDEDFRTLLAFVEAGLAPFRGPR